MSDKGKEVVTATAGADATPSNPRGIPKAPFVDNVEDYVSSRAEVEATLVRFQEMISKYQFMELNLQRRVGGLKGKLPDIEKTLETVRFLKLRSKSAGGAGDGGDDDDDGDDDESRPKPIETMFELNDTLYTKAEIPPTDEVYLWLGANVMLSYPIEEAEDLLETKHKAAKQSLTNCEEDLEFLREQITTMEVAIARVYNWDVVKKRKERAEEEKNSSSGDGSTDKENVDTKA